MQRLALAGKPEAQVKGPLPPSNLESYKKLLWSQQLCAGPSRAPATSPHLLPGIRKHMSCPSVFGPSPTFWHTWDDLTSSNSRIQTSAGELTVEAAQFRPMPFAGSAAAMDMAQLRNKDMAPEAAHHLHRHDACMPAWHTLRGSLHSSCSAGLCTISAGA